MKIKDDPRPNSGYPEIPDGAVSETSDRQAVTTDDLLLMESQIGGAAQRIAADPIIAALLEKQRELQGTKDVNVSISGVSIASDWQGKHADHPTADFFLVRKLENGKILVVVGDLAGKGVTISPNEDMSDVDFSFDGGGFICTLHERLSDNQDLGSVNSPDEAIRLIDRLVTEEPGTGEPSMLKDKHFVVTALVIDPSTRTVEGSVLGAPPVYIKEPSGEVQVINEPGTPIGLLPVDEVQVTRVDNLEPGTEIIVMTDGLTELPLRGIPESSGITPLVVDLLEKDPSLLFSSDLDEQAALPNLVHRAKENAGDDWGFVKITL